MSRRAATALLTATVLATTLAVALAACSAGPSASPSATTTRSSTASASPTGSSGASAAPTDAAPSEPADPTDEAPTEPDLPPTDPGPAIGADGTVQSYDPAAVASVCIPQVQTVYAEGSVAPDPLRSWRIDAANVAVEWSLATPDTSLTVICVITGPFAAPEFVYVTVGDL
ncbi:hypothetical protein [Microbacterium rhizomatis]|uniref:Ig-like domain-containing protein n=1 Tax=Microbacterium rhizomatis TaxID=1631477 RepID=A0A5J5J7L9_9MICO|nr:hypothetical protein [Microbacterium rhizomatis]KAA9111459.1 hypothetical protein F6B43_07785 [Microbacterium rhizomatis]